MPPMRTDKAGNRVRRAETCSGRVGRWSDGLQPRDAGTRSHRMSVGTQPVRRDTPWTGLGILIWLVGILFAPQEDASAAAARDEDPARQEHGQGSDTTGVLAASRDCTVPLHNLPVLAPWRFHPGDDPRYADPGYNDADWVTIRIGKPWERLGYKDLDGFAWYRVHFRWTGPKPCRPLALLLGTVDDADQTWLNGVLVGATGRFPPHPQTASNLRRVYPLSWSLVRQGDNVIAVRVYDEGGRGGIDGHPPRLDDLQALLMTLPLKDFLSASAPLLILILGIYHLVLFFRSPDKRHNFLFFGFALAMAAMILNRSQLPLRLGIDYSVTRELSWLGTFWSLPLLIGALYPYLKPFVRRTTWIPVIGLIVLGLLSPLMTDKTIRFELFFYLGQPAVLWLIAFVLGSLYKAKRSGDPDAGWLIAAVALLGGAAAIEIMANVGDYPKPHLLPPAIVMFILVIVIMLARREDRQARELKEKSEKLGAFNESLEHQVEERTRHLNSIRRECLEQNQLLSEFNELASHDLKAPLRGLETIAAFLENDYSDVLDSEGHRLLDLLQESTHQMRQLLDGLSSLSRVSRAKVDEVVSLNDAANSVKGLLAGDFARGSARLDIDPDLPDVLGNRTRIVETLVNLVSNGLKYNRSAAPRIRIREAEEGEPRPMPEDPAMVCIAVEDNGIGIPRAFQDEIFKPFRRLHSQKEFEGSGIGLAIVKKAVESMGGRLGVHSEEGRGSIFYFTLKRAR